MKHGGSFHIYVTNYQRVPWISLCISRFWDFTLNLVWRCVLQTAPILSPEAQRVRRYLQFQDGRHGKTMGKHGK